MEFMPQSDPNINSLTSKINITPLVEPKFSESKLGTLNPDTVKSCSKSADEQDSLFSDSDDEMKPHIKFLSNSKRLEDGRWMCRLREFNNLVFRPVTTGGRDNSAETKTKSSLISYRNLNFMGNAIDGIDHFQPLTDGDRKIIDELGLTHVPMKTKK